MLKRARSKSEFHTDGRKIPSVIMNDYSKQICAFTSEACQILNDLRKNNLLCDARVSTKEEIIDEYTEFSVHRFVLAGKPMRF